MKFKELIESNNFKECSTLNTALWNNLNGKKVEIYTNGVIETDYLYDVFRNAKKNNISVHYKYFERTDDIYLPNISFYEDFYTNFDIDNLECVIFISNTKVIVSDKILGEYKNSNDSAHVYMSNNKKDIMMLYQKVDPDYFEEFFPKCPYCNSFLVKRTNKTTMQQFWGCSNYPNCKYTCKI